MGVSLCIVFVTVEEFSSFYTLHNSPIVICHKPIIPPNRDKMCPALSLNIKKTGILTRHVACLARGRRKISASLENFLLYWTNETSKPEKFSLVLEKLDHPGKETI